MAGFEEAVRRHVSDAGRAGARAFARRKAGQWMTAGAAGVLVFLLAGCATQGGDGSRADEEGVLMSRQETEKEARPAEAMPAPKAAVADSPLRGTEWRLQSLGGKPLGDDQAVPTLMLQADTDGFGGFSGCNRYFGSYRLDAHEHMISFAGVGVTKRMCGIAQMRREGAFLSVLRSKVRLVIQGRVLAFFDEHGRELARFQDGGASAGAGGRP